MSTRNLLPAPEISEAEHVDELLELREEVSALRGEVDSLRKTIDQFGKILASARIIFGNSAQNTTVPAAGVPDSDKWEKLKAKFGGKMAEIIEALQMVGTATRTQLKKQTGGALGTVDQAIYKLRDMGLLVKNGDGWSLKS